MRTLRVTLSERQAAEGVPALAFASASDPVDAALARFPPEGPDEQQVLADIDDFPARRTAGERRLAADEAFGAILFDLRRRGPGGDRPHGSSRSGAAED
jgi:hypothetical protein